MDRHGDGTRARSRPALILLVVVAAGGCLALGWWQWERFESSTGSGQNLGYALQWPLFAAFVVFAYRRFVQLEDAPEELEPDLTAEPTEIPEDLLPQRPTVTPAETLGSDAESRSLQEYNRYLAELGREDRSSS
ncbi:transcriptional regulator [Rhodococcoides corynebacterioides]|uniref:transcriptional regulator n=1 Tax=Rhodococcoides corynebacterioides TaxID=53972 RepID=UPI003F7F1EDB